MWLSVPFLGLRFWPGGCLRRSFVGLMARALPENNQGRNDPTLPEIRQQL